MCLNEKNFLSVVFYLFSALIILSSFALAAETSPAETLAKEGVSLMNAGKIEDAILKFNEALKVDSKYDNAYMFLGNIYLSQKKYDQALLVYNAAIDMMPDAWMYKFLRANVYMRLMATKDTDKNADLAIKDFIKAFDVENNISDKYLVYAFVFNSCSSNTKDKEYRNRALNYVNRAINLNEKNDKAYNLRGIIKLDQKDFDESEKNQNKQIIFLSAINDFTKAIQCNSCYGDAYYNRGSVYINLNEYDKAIDDFTNAIKYEKKDSQFSASYFNRAFCREKKGEHNLAIVDYTKAIDKDEKNKDAYNNRGVIYAKMKNYDKALKDFTQALKIDAKYENAQHNIEILQNYENNDMVFYVTQKIGTRFNWGRTEKNKK